MAAGFKTAYGLEMSARSLILVRAIRGEAPKSWHAGEPSSAETRRVLQQVAGEVEQGLAALAVCAPATQTVIRRLRAPFASVQKAARIWPSLLDVDLPFPVEGAACVYGPPRLEQGGTVATAAAIRKSDLGLFIETCRSRGIDPTHCEAEALALWDQQAAEAPAVRAGAPRALVWLGAGHVTVVRGRGSEFMAAHVLRASAMAGTPAERTAFEALWTARMAQILAAHLAETGETEVDLWWAGPGAEDAGQVARLRQALPAACTLRHETHAQPASFLARALARRATASASLNFLRGELAHPVLQRLERRNLRAAYAHVAAAALLVLALNGGVFLQREIRLEARQRQLTAAAQAIAGPNLPHGQESLFVARALSRRDEETQPFRQALDPVGLEVRLARLLEAAGVRDVEIARLALSPEALVMEGTAASIQAMDEFADHLRSEGWGIQADSPGPAPAGRLFFILKGAPSHAG